MIEKAVQPEVTLASVTKGKTVVVGKGNESSSTGKKSSKKEKGEALPAKEMQFDILDTAAGSQKPVVLFFHMTGDRVAERTCQTMEKLVFGQKSIVELANNFHSVKIDVKGLEPSVLKQYRLKKAPTVVLLDYKGNVLSTLVGKATPQQLLASMKSAEAKNQELIKKSELASK